MRALFFQLFLMVVLSGCNGGNSSTQSISSSGTNTSQPPVTSGSWHTPAPRATWQWQLTGTVNTTYDVDVFDIDLFESSTALIQQLQTERKKVICYFSAGTYEDWRPDAGQFSSVDIGNPDDGWVGESWLDIRSSNVHTIMKARLDLAKQKDCDGVEPDNMEGYNSNSGFPLTAADQLAFNRMIANEAHLRNLSVGLKNDLDQINKLVDYFGFAVNEQCFEYSECNLLSPFISNNKAVFNAEYKQQYVNDASAKNAMCIESIAQQLSTLILPLDLDDSFRISCL
jgi:hypothetical protein